MNALDQSVAAIARAEATARYLASNIGKARREIARIETLAHRIAAQANDVGIALTRGTDALGFAEMTAETVRDLMIAARDLETYCLLIEDDGSAVASRALASRRPETLSHSGKEG